MSEQWKPEPKASAPDWLRPQPSYELSPVEAVRRSYVPRERPPTYNFQPDYSSRWMGALLFARLAGVVSAILVIGWFVGKIIFWAVT